MSDSTESATTETSETVVRTLQGKVVSTGMDKTIAVSVTRKVAHPIYKKYMKRSTKLLAHDDTNDCRMGDIVLIEECRPLSRRKSWRLQRIVERAPQV